MVAVMLASWTGVVSRILAVYGHYEAFCRRRLAGLDGSHYVTEMGPFGSCSGEVFEHPLTIKQLNEPVLGCKMIVKANLA